MITRFATTVWRASTDALAYVDDFIKRRTGTALGYLYMLTTTLAFFGLLPFVIGMAMLAPRAETFAKEQLTVLQEWYPDDLIVTISGGVLSTNRNEPVIVDLPAQWSTGEGDPPMHAVVIDTKGSIDDFSSYETFVLLTDTAGAARDDDGTLRVFEFTEIQKPVVIDQTLVDQGVAGLEEFTPALPWIAWTLVLLLVFALPWIVGFFMWVGTLFFLLLATLVVWACSSLMGRGLAYGQLYRLGVYGVTSSLLLEFALSMTGVILPLATYVVFFGWMIFVLSKFPKRLATVRSAPLPPAAIKKTPSATVQTAKPVAEKPTKKGL